MQANKVDLKELSRVADVDQAMDLFQNKQRKTKVKEDGKQKTESDEKRDQRKQVKSDKILNSMIMQKLQDIGDRDEERQEVVPFDYLDIKEFKIETGHLVNSLIATAQQKS